MDSNSEPRTDPDLLFQTLQTMGILFVCKKLGQARLVSFSEKALTLKSYKPILNLENSSLIMTSKTYYLDSIFHFKDHNFRKYQYVNLSRKWLFHQKSKTGKCANQHKTLFFNSFQRKLVIFLTKMAFPSKIKRNGIYPKPPQTSTKHFFIKSF